MKDNMILLADFGLVLENIQERTLTRMWQSAFDLRILVYSAGVHQETPSLAVSFLVCQTAMLTTSLKMMKKVSYSLESHYLRT